MLYPCIPLAVTLRKVKAHASTRRSMTFRAQRRRAKVRPKAEHQHSTTLRENETTHGWILEGAHLKFQRRRRGRDDVRHHLSANELVSVEQATQNPEGRDESRKSRSVVFMPEISGNSAQQRARLCMWHKVGVGIKKNTGNCRACLVLCLHLHLHSLRSNASWHLDGKRQGIFTIFLVSTSSCHPSLFDPSRLS